MTNVEYLAYESALDRIILQREVCASIAILTGIRISPGSSVSSAISNMSSLDGD